MTPYAHSLDTDRELTQQLSELGLDRAPASLLPAVLTTLGLGDWYTTMSTPLGPVYVAYSRHGISLITQAERREAFEIAYRNHTGRPVNPVEVPPGWLAQAFNRWMNGAKPGVSFDLQYRTEFERSVLLKAQEIPRGEVRPYSWIAREIGHPRAVRAVGTALAHNPVPLLIPCHRVVRSDGMIGQYGLGGPVAKRSILTAEGVEVDSLEALGRSGVRLVGSDSTHIFCFPTCRQARRIGDSHRVSFATESAASAAGYRPCKLCRPALVA